jgi:general secretion pathway protein D
MARSPIQGLTLLLLPFLLAGCAAQRAYQEGNALVAQDKVGAGLAKYQEALAADPGNPEYKAAYLRARDGAVVRMVEAADRLLAAGQADVANGEYRRVLTIDPGNDRARAGLRQVEADRRHATALAEARAAFDKDDLDTARNVLAAVLTERPSHEAARLLMLEIDEKAAKAPSGPAALAASYRKPISLEFRDAPLKQVFEIIARHSGLNFIFDKDVKADTRTSIFLKNSTVEAAVYYLLMTNQLERQVMDGNTILIYPNIAAKLREYQEMTVKTFFLANADAKSIANTFKTILKARDVVVDEKLNLVILRDNPEAIRIATQLVALQDVPEPEVMLDVEVLEISRSSVMDLGINWPGTLSFSPLQALDGGAITIDNLRGLNSSNILAGPISASLSANKTDGDTTTLANPRIRVRNKEKAKIVIGDKIPNISATVSSGIGGFASENITYLDVGLTLNVEPIIYLNNEVAIRVNLEVSTLGAETRTDNGTVAYRIGSRSASTLLQLKDGENQVLAGLISNEDRNSGSKVPGVGDLPIVGRLFGSQTDSTGRTEILLSITPHIVRSVQRPPASASEFSAGTEASFRRRPDTSVRTSVVIPAPAVRPAAPAQQSGTVTTPVAPPPAQGSPSSFSVPISALPATPQLGSPPSASPGVPAAATADAVPPAPATTITTTVTTTPAATVETEVQPAAYPQGVTPPVQQ